MTRIPREIILSADPVDMVNAIMEWANCTFAEIDSDGDVWIEGPQSGHWLSDDRLAEFIAWCGE